MAVSMLSGGDSGSGVSGAESFVFTIPTSPEAVRTDETATPSEMAVISTGVKLLDAGRGAQKGSVSQAARRVVPRRAQTIGSTGGGSICMIAFLVWIHKCPRRRGRDEVVGGSAGGASELTKH